MLMSAGEVRTNQYILRPKTVKPSDGSEEKKGMLIGDTDGMLVKVNPDAPGGYDLVEKISSPISTEELRDNYGIWNDKTRGHFWKKEPKDGKIQRDEVTPIKTQFPGQLWQMTCPYGDTFAGHHVGYVYHDQWELRDYSANVAFKQSSEGPVPILTTQIECKKTKQLM
jgi:hypothetical protein